MEGFNYNSYLSRSYFNAEKLNSEENSQNVSGRQILRKSTNSGEYASIVVKDKGER